MTLPLKQAVKRARQLKKLDVTRDDQLLSKLKDFSPCEAGRAVTELCSHLVSSGFQEVVLNPFTAHPIDYHREVMDVPGVGQLRYNTEPEIWGQCGSLEKFFSTSTLFRKEKTCNLLRRQAFLIVDFYQPGSPDSMLDVFKGILKRFAKMGVLTKLHELPFEYERFDPVLDGPASDSLKPRWIVTKGYDADSSFFEIDELGKSTRNELFLATPRGFLEIAAVGIVGWNKNRDYLFRGGPASVPLPTPNLSGMGFGLERLLLAEQVLAIAERLGKK